MASEQIKGSKQRIGVPQTSLAIKAFHQRLKQVLHYDKNTGAFTWKVHLGRVTKGTPGAAPYGNGYLGIGLFGEKYLAHRLAWFYHYGKWPANCIDHLNGNRSDNRIKNLRDVTHAENLQNCPRALGVWFSHKKWNAGLMFHGKHINLGRYETYKEARAAYMAGKREFHPFASS